MSLCYEKAGIAPEVVSINSKRNEDGSRKERYGIAHGFPLKGVEDSCSDETVRR